MPLGKGAGEGYVHTFGNFGGRPVRYFILYPYKFFVGWRSIIVRHRPQAFFVEGTC